MLIGYARVSTTEQNLDLQRDALLKARVAPKDLYTDKVTGVKADRPGLQAALSHLRGGDTLVVWRLDRLPPSARMPSISSVRTWCAASGVIVLEDLHVKGMVRNRHLARAISDMGFGVFRRLVDYKATAAGVQVVYAERWFPSCKLCSSCGAVCDDLPLSQRVYNCACGFLADRDLNAALNLSNYSRLVGK
jgi:IS605 OrfB family transposase